jgi:uncharacterized protein (UPF0548 family)
MAIDVSFQFHAHSGVVLIRQENRCEKSLGSNNRYILYMGSLTGAVIRSATF